MTLSDVFMPTAEDFTNSNVVADTSCLTAAEMCVNLYHLFLLALLSKLSSRQAIHKKYNGQNVIDLPSVRVSFNVARDFCAAIGGRLPRLPSDLKGDGTEPLGTATVFLDTLPSDNRHLAAESVPLNRTHTYLWSDNSTITHPEWYCNQPQCKQQCCYVAFYLQRLLSDYSCEVEQAVVCILPDDYTVNNSLIRLLAHFVPSKVKIAPVTFDLIMDLALNKSRYSFDMGELEGYVNARSVDLFFKREHCLERKKVHWSRVH